MNRREFISSLTAAAGVGLIGLPNAAAASQPVTGFYAAGARFYSVPSGLRQGCRAILEKGFWQSQPCLRILTEQRQLIGHVPKSRLADVAPKSNLRWKISAFDRHAVPWKRYFVALDRFV